ncbi:hypothetical protein QQX98_009522 [Neonectria punicea]|uniref:Isopentenyl transferase n=1 Tax=Neonectria punicea TaxID=979145 RepID=A0ABR1GS74_9HYPO
MTTPLLIVAVIGPTGIGKTRLSVKIAKAIDGEVISVDSIQVYRDCPIMAAQVTVEEMEDVPHHSVNYLDAAEEPVDFITKAVQSIKSIHNRGRVPVICGGSTSLIEPLLFHPSIKQQNLLVLALSSDVATISKLCDDRIEQMLKDGLLDEVKRLYELEKQHGRYNDTIRTGAWKSIGYPELRTWCTAENTKEATGLLQEGTQLMRQNTLNYINTQLQLLWSRLIPVMSRTQRHCHVLNVVSRQTFSQEVELPAVRLCKEWMLDTERESTLEKPLKVEYGTRVV